MAHVMLQARELAWDAGRQMLVPLDPHLRLRLQNEVWILVAVSYGALRG